MSDSASRNISRVAADTPRSAGSGRRENDDGPGSASGGWPSASGYPRSFLDSSVAPGEDFYRFAVGGYEDRLIIPPDRAGYGLRSELAQRVEASLREILEEAAYGEHAPGTPERRLGDFYASGLDTEAMDARGCEPVADWLALIDSVADLEGLHMAVTTMHRAGLAGLFVFASSAGLHDPGLTVGWADQGGLGLGSESYYTSNSPRNLELRDKYERHIASVLKPLGGSGYDARRALAVEMRLANASQSTVQRRHPGNYDFPLNRRELGRSMSRWDWSRYLDEMGVAPGADRFNLGNPVYFAALDRSLEEVPLLDWRAYLRWQVARQTCPYLGTELREAHFEFFSATLNGVEERSPRWRVMVGLAEALLGATLGRKFVERCFSAEARESAARMIHGLVAVLRERIEDRPWLGASAKAQALAKLDGLEIKVGYPDCWEDDSDCEIGRDFFSNVMAAKGYSRRRDIARIGGPVDRSQWAMSPCTVNAYYSPQRNEIAFPAARLLPPFFDPQGDAAVNFGSTGVTVGHELTHGFDDSGARYDASGALSPWWKPNDERNFREIASAVMEQMSEFHYQGVPADGRLTTGEALADLGGLELAYAAMCREVPDEGVEGFTRDQRFFLAYAASRQEKLRPEAALNQLRTAVHPLPSFRVLEAVSNFEPFYQAFEVEPGQALFRPGEERVRLWV